MAPGCRRGFRTAPTAWRPATSEMSARQSDRAFPRLRRSCGSLHGTAPRFYPTRSDRKNREMGLVNREIVSVKEAGRTLFLGCKDRWRRLPSGYHLLRTIGFQFVLKLKQPDEIRNAHLEIVSGELLRHPAERGMDRFRNTPFWRGLRVFRVHKAVVRSFLHVRFHLRAGENIPSQS